MPPLDSGLLDDHVTALGPRLRLALTATASRNRSLAARELLARAALGDHLTLDALLAAARAGDRRVLRRIRRRVRPALVTAVAQTIALQDLLPTDTGDALALYELIRRALGTRALTPANQALHAQLVLAHEGPERCRRLLRRYRAVPEQAAIALAIDLANPFGAARPAGGSAVPTAGGSAVRTAGGSAVPTVGGPAVSTAGGSAVPSAGGPAVPSAGGSAVPSAGGPAVPSAGGSAVPTVGGTAVSAAGAAVPVSGVAAPARGTGAWHAAFGALTAAPGPVVTAGDGVPFDRLTTAPVERVESAHRVSVVVTAYRPDAGLLTAVRSILAQSWANVEVVIVDDASPPEFDPMLAEAVALGERIRLVKLPVNSGTYVARNAGLDAAGGEFAAFQDSDDWSHPRRLELQVRPLIEDRRLVATTSDGVAVTDDLVLTRPGVRSGRFNPSSLVFRRTRVLREIGYFDRVRKAGDSEYIERMRTVFGGDRVRHLDLPPLALIRLSAGSLSRSEIKAHWMHPARTAYMSAYLRWHQHVAEGRAKGYRPADGSARPFPAPDHLLGITREKAYDVVVVADWRFLESTQRTAVDELRALAAAGLRVAVLHLESYRAAYLKRHPLAAPVQDLINAGTVDRVALAERVTAGLVLVRQVAVLQFAGEQLSGIHAARTMLVADRAPHRTDSSDRRYLPADCAEAAARLFGTAPTWVPQDAGVRALLRTESVAPDDLPVALSAPGWVADRTGVAPGPAIVGTDLADAAAWPADPAAALACLRRLKDADVRVRLPDRPRGELDVRVPRGWLGYEAADLEPRAFGHQLDFYLHFPAREAAEWYSRPAFDAAAAGCVVVMPERYAALYGDAAVYCGGSEVGALIARYRADPALYAEQSRRARAVVAAVADPARFVDRILAELPVTAAAGAALPSV